MRNTWLNTVFLIIIWDMIDSMYFYFLRAVRLIYCICIHLHLFALKSHVAPCKKDGDKFETWRLCRKHHLKHSGITYVASFCAFHGVPEKNLSDISPATIGRMTRARLT